jgi:hypothetical protein
MKKLSPNAATYTAVALIAIGLLMVFLGWNGAAGVEAARDLRAQFPYLLSGGLFGVALVGAGLVLVRTFEGRRDAKEIVAQLERLALAVERMEVAQQQRLLAEANARETALEPPVAAVPGAYAPPAAPPAAPPFESAR